MPLPKVMVFSRRQPEEGGLSRMLADDGYQVEWTDSGPAAICEALTGTLAACVIAVGRNADREVDYLPCLNRVAPSLPIVVMSDHDSIELQRKVRRHKVFYYLIEPVDRGEFRSVLRSAIRPAPRRRRRA